MATVVFALGALFVYGALMMHVTIFDYYASYAPVASWANEKLWEDKDMVMREGGIESSRRSGEVTIGERKYKWESAQAPMEASESLFRVSLVVSWKAGGRSFAVKRTGLERYGK